MTRLNPGEPKARATFRYDIINFDSKESESNKNVLNDVRQGNKCPSAVNTGDHV
ncbi:hypothetical protein SAMN03159290_02640 [Pseudomonas sp. NFACC13-1]|nr:hypothetical protein SAMN03159290_02640 [Pseudomonas sp. NFACC13-1]